MEFLTVFILGVIGISTINADAINCAYNTNCARTENVIVGNSVPVENFRQAVRFGFDTPAVPLGPYHRPNCGCVTRGACSGEAGLYTRQVIQRSDLSCGTRFESCCYDGPYQGVADEFARAAACVPEEQCVRPYGILPTDVRDFGTIAPCPGRGVVRCLCLVNGVDQLEFKAALASIAAAQAQSQVSVDSAQLAPTHIEVPIVQSVQPVPSVGTHSTVSTYTSTSVDQGSIAAPAPVPAPAPARLPSPTYTSTYVGSSIAAPASVPAPTPTQLSGSTYTSTYAGSSVAAPASIPAPIPAQLPGSTYTSTYVGSSVAATAPAPAPVPVPAPVPASAPVPAPVPAPLPAPSGLYGGPGLLGSPLFGGLGLGYGGGIGFRKHISFSKGFGFGLGK